MLTPGMLQLLQPAPIRIAYLRLVLDLFHRMPEMQDRYWNSLDERFAPYLHVDVAILQALESEFQQRFVTELETATREELRDRIERFEWKLLRAASERSANAADDMIS